MSPDGHNTITHHPNVFHLHQMESQRNLARSPARATGVEPSDEHHDPIARHASHPSADVESQLTAGNHHRLPPHVNLERDPYGLSFAYKTEDDLAQIKANTGKKRDGCTYPLKARARKTKVQGFYENQNAAIERMLKSVDEHRAEAKQEAGDDQLKFKIAVWGSFAANVVLAAIQLFAAISSGSLSLFTTMADAVFDPLSNLTLILASRAIARVDARRFPAGKARLETTGNIVFCFLMAAVSVVIIAFACQELARKESDKEFYLPSVISVCCAFATKFALFLYCWAIKDKYSQVNILWQDHRNDLFVNGFGILTSVGGAKLAWWIDPMGAIILSVGITAIWLWTAFNEFMLLVGVASSVDTQQLITYVCLTHSDSIEGIDTVRCYHSGPRLIAEVDIVMDRTRSLEETHDVAEALQFKLESLPDIERAYVHIDYETTHKPEHAVKKDL